MFFTCLVFTKHILYDLYFKTKPISALWEVVCISKLWASNTRTAESFTLTSTALEISIIEIHLVHWNDLLPEPFSLSGAGQTSRCVPVLQSGIVTSVWCKVTGGHLSSTPRGHPITRDASHPFRHHRMLVANGCKINKARQMMEAAPVRKTTKCNKLWKFYNKVWEIRSFSTLSQRNIKYLRFCLIIGMLDIKLLNLFSLKWHGQM